MRICVLMEDLQQDNVEPNEKPDTSCASTQIVNEHLQAYLESALVLHLLHHPLGTSDPSRRLARWLLGHTIRLVTRSITPDSILRSGLAEPGCVLIALDPLSPLPADFWTVNHDVDLLTVVP